MLSSSPSCSSGPSLDPRPTYFQSAWDRGYSPDSVGRVWIYAPTCPLDPSLVPRLPHGRGVGQVGAYIYGFKKCTLPIVAPLSEQQRIAKPQDCGEPFKLLDFIRKALEKICQIKSPQTRRSDSSVMRWDKNGHSLGGWADCPTV